MAEERVYDKLPEIKPGERPKVLLVGNGLNRSFENKVIIEDVIKKEWNSNYGYDITDSDADDPSPVWNLPFPMQIAAATKGHVQSCLTDLAETFKGYSVEPKQDALIKEMLDAEFDTVLSTNYSLEIEKSTIADYTDRKVLRRYKQTDKSTTTQTNLGIFQCLVS